MSTGMSVFDGIILAWKLYNRLGNKQRTKKRSKSKNILSALFAK